ncbi:hypothetical protein [Subtercola boreus]|uniref:hypothetical protein n=1 Tax=Subtercola boreus TaxID=120213 RepID=UPI0015598298|nr:hypothetical protein [Subtercola boreus]
MTAATVRVQHECTFASVIEAEELDAPAAFRGVLMGVAMSVPFWAALITVWTLR